MSEPEDDDAARSGVAVDARQLMVTVAGVSRTFGIGHTAVRALTDVSFSIRKGQLVALCGRSGSGKTGLLNIIGGLDLPTSGTVLVDGQDTTAMSEDARLMLRRRTVAFIFQSFGLIPTLSAAENVGIPLRINGTDPRVREGAGRADAGRGGLGRARQAAPERTVRRSAAAGRDRQGACLQPPAADRR